MGYKSPPTAVSINALGLEHHINEHFSKRAIPLTYQSFVDVLHIKHMSTSARARELQISRNTFIRWYSVWKLEQKTPKNIKTIQAVKQEFEDVTG